MQTAGRHHVANRVAKIFSLEKAWPKKIKKADNKTFRGETGSLICSTTGFKFGKLFYNECVSTSWLRNSTLRRLFTGEKGLCKNDKRVLYKLPKLGTPHVYSRRAGRLFIAETPCVWFLTHLSSDMAVSSEKGRGAGTCNHKHEACRRNEEWEKPETKQLTLCGSIYRSCWGGVGGGRGPNSSGRIDWEEMGGLPEERKTPYTVFGVQIIEVHCWPKVCCSYLCIWPDTYFIFKKKHCENNNDMGVGDRQTYGWHRMSQHW